MLDSQEMDTSPDTPTSELASEFATWIERVTHLPAEEHQPRHRAGTA